MATPKKYPRTVRELVDYDYGARLTAADAAYLDRFTEEYYGAAFKGERLHGDADRRALYVTKNERNADIYGRGVRSGGYASALEAEAIEREWNVPEYEGDSDYREALSAFRAKIPTDRRKNAPKTHDFLTARAKVLRLSGALTSAEGGAATVALNQMAKSKLERLKALRDVVWKTGVIVTRATYTGAEAESAVMVMSWLSDYVEKIDTKLKALGYTPPAPPKEGANGPA